jgi:hypothetical protein
MKMGFERGALSLPTPEEELRSELLPLREKKERQRAELIRQLAEIESLADELGLDLQNDYDERMNIKSYADVRNVFLARGMAIGDELEEVEDLLEHIAERLGEKRTHDA